MTTELIFDGNLNIGNGNLGKTAILQLSADVELWNQFPERPHKYIIEPISISRVIVLPKIGTTINFALVGHSLNIKNSSTTQNLIIQENSINNVLYTLIPSEEVFLIATVAGIDTITADSWDRTGPVGQKYIRPPATALNGSIMIWNNGNAEYAKDTLITIDSSGNLSLPPGTNVYVGGTPISSPSGVTQVNTGAGLSGGPITSTGTIIVANTGVAAGTYHSPLINVNTRGQLTSASNILNTLGDLLVYNGTTSTRQPVGINNYVLTSDSSSPTGLSWKSILDIFRTMSIVDSFGRLRTSQSHTLFTSQYGQDKLPEKYDEIISNSSGSATSVFNSTISAVVLTVGQNDFIIRKTRRNFEYTPNNVQKFLYSGILTIQTNITKRIGLYTSAVTTPYAPLNGLFFETSGGKIFTCIANNGTITSVEQANWNVDKLNGTGLSGITLDLTKSQVFAISYSWLGVGQVEYSIIIGRNEYIVHRYVHGNFGTNAYMAKANLAITKEIRAANIAATTGTLTHICCAVSSEGGTETIHDMYSSGRFATTAARLNNTSTSQINVLLCIKLKNNVEGVVAYVKDMSVSMNDVAEVVGIIIYVNPTFNNTVTFTSAGTNSVVEFNNSTTNSTWIVSSERVLANYYIGRYNSERGITFNDPLYLTSKINGVGDTYAIGLSSNVSSNDAVGSVNWIEL